MRSCHAVCYNASIMNREFSKHSKGQSGRVLLSPKEAVELLEAWADPKLVLAWLDVDQITVPPTEEHYWCSQLTVARHEAQQKMKLERHMEHVLDAA